MNKIRFIEIKENEEQTCDLCEVLILAGETAIYSRASCLIFCSVECQRYFDGAKESCPVCVSEGAGCPHLA